MTLSLSKLGNHNRTSYFRCGEAIYRQRTYIAYKIDSTQIVFKFKNKAKNINKNKVLVRRANRVQFHFQQAAACCYTALQSTSKNEIVTYNFKFM